MKRQSEHRIAIWFFIGVIVLVYGVLILGVGVRGWLAPPPAGERVVLWNLHADVWWGIVLLFIGLFYVLRYRPWKNE